MIKHKYLIVRTLNGNDYLLPNGNDSYLPVMKIEDGKPESSSMLCFEIRKLMQWGNAKVFGKAEMVMTMDYNDEA